ncbi:hypothetical protein, partial [Gelidibacter sp.]|uniref:hypothetical protein n=1 Tax=Gelidibacter sp. TaxID=2018083 RepID=UPI002CE46854
GLATTWGICLFGGAGRETTLGDLHECNATTTSRSSKTDFILKDIDLGLITRQILNFKSSIQNVLTKRKRSHGIARPD